MNSQFTLIWTRSSATAEGPRYVSERSCCFTTYRS